MQTTSTSTSGSASQSAIMEYHARIRLTLEYSTVLFHPSADQDRLWRAVAKAPGWKVQLSWPPTSSHSDAALLYTGLTKLKLLFDAGAQLAADGADELSERIRQRFPDVEVLHRAGSIDNFSLFKVTGTIWDNGSSQWAYHVLQQGALPPSVAAEPPSSLDEFGNVRAHRGPLVLFLQNVARADLMARLAKLASTV